MRSMMTLTFCLLLALVTLSGDAAPPPPIEVHGYEPDMGALVKKGCPSGSCDKAA